MHQYKQVGGGTTEDKKYTTWEIKECPACGRLTREYYEAKVITKADLKFYDGTATRTQGS
jgi:NMD protein affecting ribosome stability and mRNA decay